MPIYSIKNTSTDEIFEINIKYIELDGYLTENPTFKQIFNKFPGVADPTRLGMKKPDEGFRDVLKEVKSHHKHNNINTW
jgi:hypothetical protein